MRYSNHARLGYFAFFEQSRRHNSGVVHSRDAISGKTVIVGRNTCNLDANMGGSYQEYPHPKLTVCNSDYYNVITELSKLLRTTTVNLKGRLRLKVVKLGHVAVLPES